jgi:hypothetical protein
VPRVSIAFPNGHVREEELLSVPAVGHHVRLPNGPESPLAYVVVFVQHTVGDEGHGAIVTITVRPYQPGPPT